MRCYDGCPDSELQAHMDAIAAEKKRLADRIPGARCVYFPNGEFYQCFNANHLAISAECKTLFGAVQLALREGT